MCLKKSLKKELDQFDKYPRLNRTRAAEKEAVDSKLTKYISEAFGPDGSTLHPKGKHAAYSVQCPSPPGFEDSGLTSFLCASGLCPNCGIYCQPCLEKDSQRPINFYSFKTLPTCSICGALAAGSETCSLCAPSLSKPEGNLGREYTLC